MSWDLEIVSPILALRKCLTEVTKYYCSWMLILCFKKQDQRWLEYRAIEALGTRRRYSNNKMPLAWAEAGGQREAAAVNSHTGLVMVKGSANKEGDGLWAALVTGIRDSDMVTFIQRQISINWKGEWKEAVQPVHHRETWVEMGNQVKDSDLDVVERHIRWGLWWKCGISHDINHNLKKEATRSQQGHGKAGFLNILARLKSSHVLLNYRVHSEKCVIKRPRPCVSSIKRTYTSVLYHLGGIAYYTPMLYGITYCP